MYVFAVASRLYSGGGLAGFSAYPYRYVLSAGVVFFVGAASYSLALLARTPLAGAVIGLYWVLALAGKSYLPKAVFPSYSQNLLGYLLLGVFLISVACWFHRKARRGKRAAPAPVWLSAAVSLALCVATVLRGLATEHDPMVHADPALDLMSYQTATMGELAPGFRLPDAHGNLASLADYPGKILIIALWSPDDSESTIILDRLEEIREQYGRRGIQPIAICLSEDRTAAGIFARGADVHFPVVHDWGTHNAEKTSATSPLATAYEADSLPHVVVTDRRRKIQHVLNGVDAYEGNALERVIDERLAAEPE
jgi:peroxiredoxin